jgi:hypothetical protein
MGLKGREPVQLGQTDRLGGIVSVEIVLNVAPVDSEAALPRVQRVGEFESPIVLVRSV